MVPDTSVWGEFPNWSSNVYTNASEWRKHKQQQTQQRVIYCFSSARSSFRCLFTLHTHSHHHAHTHTSTFPLSHKRVVSCRPKCWTRPPIRVGSIDRSIDRWMGDHGRSSSGGSSRTGGVLHRNRSGSNAIVSKIAGIRLSLLPAINVRLMFNDKVYNHLSGTHEHIGFLVDVHTFVCRCVIEADAINEPIALIKYHLHCHLCVLEWRLHNWLHQDMRWHNAYEIRPFYNY